MEGRFGHDFSQVRVHTGPDADRSAKEHGALAYALGRDIVFSSGQYQPDTPRGRRILAHELAHVMQQESAPARVQPAINPLPGGGWNVRTPHHESTETASLETEADRVAEHVLARDAAAHEPPGPVVRTSTAATQTVLRTRVPVPNTPLCGKTLTDIEVLPPATKDLEPCLPKGTPFTRINIVGRDATSPSGKNQVFNVHAGYYTDAATGHYCAMVDDSKMCLCPRCVPLGCFPTLKEVVEAITSFLETVLKILGIILLIAIMAVIAAALLELILAPAAVLASSESEAQPDDGDAASPDEAAATAVA